MEITPDLGENSRQEIIVYLDNSFSCFFKTRKITLILRIKAEIWHQRKNIAIPATARNAPAISFQLSFS